MPNHVPLFLHTPQPNLSTFSIRRGSVSNLVRRAQRVGAESSRLCRVIEVLELRLMKTKNEVCPLVPPTPTPAPCSPAHSLPEHPRGKVKRTPGF
jgi:hypothetical protein